MTQISQISHKRAFIQKLAKRLYKQVPLIVIWPIVSGLVIGLMFGGIFAIYANDPISAKIDMAAGFFMGLTAGYLVGRERSFRLRLEARNAARRALMKNAMVSIDQGMSVGNR